MALPPTWCALSGKPRWGLTQVFILVMGRGVVTTVPGRGWAGLMVGQASSCPAAPMLVAKTAGGGPVTMADRLLPSLPVGAPSKVPGPWFLGSRLL